MKAKSKFLADLIALCVVLPAFVCYRISCWFFRRDQAFSSWSQAFSIAPGIIGAYLRRNFYRMTFDYCAANVWIGFGTIFSHPGCRIGPKVYVGCYCCLGEITLEQDVLIGSHVSIMNGSAQHGIERLDIPIREQPGIWPHITIGPDTWIGDRAIIMADVGAHCVVGAGSVVTKPLPDFAVAVGSPAKIVRFRNSSDQSVRPPA